MTASLYATGTHVASVAQDPPEEAEGERRNRIIDVAHAVARPVVDGLTASVCGALVTALADVDWTTVRGSTRCWECRRIAG